MAERGARIKATMTPELWQRLKPLYEAALETPEELRAQFIVDACSNDHEMKIELEALLDNEGQSSPFDGPLINIKGLFGDADRVLAEGELIEGRFQIVRHLGQGGMGEVYEANDLQLGRIALKTIRSDLAASKEQLARFKKEVQLARRVTSPHVCRIHELHLPPFAADGPQDAFLTMEFLEGITLTDIERRTGPTQL